MHARGGDELLAAQDLLRRSQEGDQEARPEAIAIVCTNMRGPLVAAALERRLGIPVLDSVAFTLWGCLDAIGVPTEKLAGFGSIFAPRVQPSGKVSTLALES